MTNAPSDIARLPMRMTTSEVCAVARFSKATLQRRIKTGLIDLKPIDRGQEKLYLRADVVRALGLADDVVASPTPAPVRPLISVDKLRARCARSKTAKRQKNPPPPLQPKPEPMTPERTRAFLLNLRPGVRIQAHADGKFSVLFVARQNVRASTWPSEIMLPRANPGPVTLDSEVEYETLLAEALTVHAECRAALKAEKAQEG